MMFFDSFHASRLHLKSSRVSSVFFNPYVSLSFSLSFSLNFSLSFSLSLVPQGGCGRNVAVFPLYSLLAPPWQSGCCGTGAARPGTEWWGTPYKEDNSSGVGPAELSHAARSQVPPLGCWLSPLLHLKTCNSFFPLLCARQLLHEALNQPLEAS